jgi:hypothetical protein
MSDRYKLDIQNPERIPAPPVPKWFTRDLGAALPRNPFGEPQLIVGWGMEITTFRNGNPFDAKYIAMHERIVKRIFRRLDVVEGRYEYFQTRDDAANAVNINLGVHPKTGQPVIDYKEIKGVRHWGPPVFVVEQWHPPERIDPPHVWARNRHEEIQGRSGQKVRVDVLGPYPSRGQYRELIQIADVDSDFLWEMAIADIRRRIKEREIRSFNDYTAAQEMRDFYTAEAQKQEKIDTLIDDSLDDFASTSKYRMTGLGPIWPKITPGSFMKKLRDARKSSQTTEGAP